MIQDGSWAQEAIEGMFNKTCSIAYPNFKFSFTIWMLGRAHLYLEELDKAMAVKQVNGDVKAYPNGSGDSH
jgi:lanosterol synthase